jgi:branched-chain amino acid aminotransferase
VLCILRPLAERLSSLGTGAYKVGANYAPAVFPQKQAAESGYVQNLWLSGPEHSLTEVRPYNPPPPCGCFV